MKKILAFVLAIVMVLGMATVAFAAPGSDIYYKINKDDAAALTTPMAAGDINITAYPTVSFTTTETAVSYKDCATGDIVLYVTPSVKLGTYYVEKAADATHTMGVQDADEVTQYFSIAAYQILVQDDQGNLYPSQNESDVTGTGMHEFVADADRSVANKNVPSKYFVTITWTLSVDDIDPAYAFVTAPAANVPQTLFAANSTITYTAPTYKYVSLEVVESLYAAYLSHITSVRINLDDASIYNETITALDWNWLLNNYAGLAADLNDILVVASYNADGTPATFLEEGVFTIRGLAGGASYTTDAKTAATLGDSDFAWWKTAQWQYLAMDYELFNSVNTVFTITAGDIDYTWNKAIDFRMDDGLRGYIKEGKTEYTSAEIYAFIRALTGDTKNPYTFGWTVAKAGAEVAVPHMTVSYVIPQQWINVYGHKNLSLWVYGNSEKCDVCGATHQMGHQITTTTVDATTQTQRIKFTTNSFYRTLVLSQTATEAASEPTDDNPNTGANDIVNVAIVFAVISLVAAGAFVFSKQR